MTASEQDKPDTPLKKIKRRKVASVQPACIPINSFKPGHTQIAVCLPNETAESLLSCIRSVRNFNGGDTLVSKLFASENISSITRELKEKDESISKALEEIALKNGVIL